MAARKRGVRTIPQEIMTEILYRLPAKSVGRFRCVSKGWLSLLTDPQFIKTHKNNTLNQHHLIFQPELDNEHYSGEKAPTKFNLESNFGADEFYFSSSCDGLVLVIFQGCGGTLYLVNPTTRENLQLNYEVEMIEYVEDLNVQFQYGFGYDIVTDDYKVVLVTYFHGYTSDQEDADEVEGVCVYVYSLRNNTWKRVIDSPYHKHYDIHYETDGVFVNGFIHWIVRKGVDDNALPLIAAFSLADESFSELPSPDFCNTPNMFIRNDSQLVVLGGKLAIFIKSEAEVWLMNEYGVTESWTKISLHGINKIPIFKTERCRLPLLVLDDYCKIQVANNNDRMMMVYEVEKGTFSSKTTVCVWNPKTFRLYILTLKALSR